MSAMRLGHLFAGLFLAAAVIAVPAVPAQNKDEKKVEKKDDDKKKDDKKDKDDIKEEVSIETYDGISLKGDFYKGSKGATSNVVMILPEFGKDRTKGDWDSLARKLVDEGLAVLIFDFRGHGASTRIIDPTKFWQQEVNAKRIKGGGPMSKKETLSLKDFGPNYFPWLIQDIAAARRFLDLKNDAAECNVSNLIVIGSKEMAALGYLWMTSEWNREAVAQNAGAVIGAVQPAPSKMAGTDLACGVWLSFSSSPLGLNMPYTPQANDQMKQMLADARKVPHLFLYGADDRTGATAANYMYTNVLKATTGTPKLDTFTFKKDVGKTNLTGVELLGKSGALTTEDLIVKYVIDKVAQKRGNMVRFNRNANMAPFNYTSLAKIGFVNWP
jgi:hypothetical protein